MRYLLASMGALGLSLAGCSGDDTTKDGTETGSPEETGGDTGGDTVTDTGTPSTPDASFVRVVHLGPDAPPVDVFVDDAEPAAITDVAFQGGTDYVELSAGAYNFKVSVADDAPTNAVLSADLTLDPGVSYAAVAHGYLSDAAPGDLQLTAFVENRATVPTGQQRLHVVHAASRTPAVDLWDVTDPNSPQPILSDVPYGADAELDFATPGAFELGVDATDDGVPDLVYSVPDLGAGYFSVYAVNSGSDATPFDVDLVAQLPDGSTVTLKPNAYVRVLHLGPDAPAVDVFVDEVHPPAVEGAPFKAGSGYLALPIDTYNFKVSVTGSRPSDAVLDADLPLSANVRYAAVAHGYLADPSPGNLALTAFVEEVSGIASTDTRLQIVHAASRTPAVDIWNVTDPDAPTPIFTDVAYGGSGVVDVPDGALVVGLDATSDGVPDLVYDVPALGGGFVGVYAVNRGVDAGAFDVDLVAQLSDGSTVTLTPRP